MELEDNFIEHLKKERPEEWSILKRAAIAGLLIIDEDVDAVTVTNRLLWTNSNLHECLSKIINEWVECEHLRDESFLEKMLLEFPEGVRRHG